MKNRKIPEILKREIRRIGKQTLNTVSLKREDALRTLAYQRTVRENGVGAIRNTKRICYPEAEYSIHMVTCHKHVDMAMWCLKSFSYYAEQTPPFTIHDDGTLTKNDKELLRNQLKPCTVIDKSESDKTMNETLRTYPHCRQMRAKSEFYCALKLFDPSVYTQTDVIVLIDSDILFFQRPSELINCVKRGKPCFNSDYQDAYAVPAEELRRRLNINVLSKVNAGLVVLRRVDYDLNFMERYFACFSSPIRDVNRHEQTLHALLLSRSEAHRLSNSYQISRQRISTTTVSHHFVNDGSRAYFYTKGVRKLKQPVMFTTISNQEA